MTPAIKTFIEENKKIREAATSGEWVKYGNFSVETTDQVDICRTFKWASSFEQASSDRAFIAHAANNYLTILDALSVAVETIERFKISQKNLDRLHEVDNKTLQMIVRQNHAVSTDVLADISKRLGVG